VIGLTTGESTSARATPPYRACSPTVVVIVLDDAGFAQLGCYGSDIATPSIDALAGRGVRLTNFHATAVCSPTRACLLTGRNHHRGGVGWLPHYWPGLWIPNSSTSLLCGVGRPLPVCDG
jgi:arylsulfatase A-like enzyme